MWLFDQVCYRAFRFTKSYSLKLSDPSCLYSISFDESFERSQCIPSLDFGSKWRGRWSAGTSDQNSWAHKSVRPAWKVHSGLAISQPSQHGPSVDGLSLHNWKFYKELGKRRGAKSCGYWLTLAAAAFTQIIHGAFKHEGQAGSTELRLEYS